MRTLFLMFALLYGGLCINAQHPIDEPVRSSARSSLEPFYHGVASGDPLADQVIIWTRVTTSDSTKSVQWRIATDTGMVNLIDSGIVTTSSAVDYTVKVDVMNLTPNTFYYYEFESDGMLSIRGRTRTAPVGDIDSIRFAVVSCSRYKDGFFNAYNRITARNDVSAVLHLGDYYYEGGGADVRATDPNYEILNLNDYRMRLSHYKLDEDLLRLHQQQPFICVWDDHETADNSWYGGANNHDANEGNWFDRKAQAIQAYYEWLPVRMPDPSVDTQRIYRRFNYGNLIDLHMLDTRLQGREEQSWSTATDPNRTILGMDQFNWLIHGMDTSSAQWQLIGQQVMMAPLRVNPLPFGQQYANDDQWDGYEAERANLYDSLFAKNIENMVVLTGDIHTSWANDLPTGSYNPSTGSGSAGVEFVVSSVTTLNGPAILNSTGSFLITSLNDHIKYADLSEKGYYIIDVNKTRTQVDWFYVDRVDQPSTIESYGTSWQTLDGSRHLTSAPAAAIPDSGQIGLMAPLDPRVINTIPIRAIQSEIQSVLLGVYPNPFKESITLHYTLNVPQNVQVSIYDPLGHELMQKDLGIQQQGIFQTSISTTKLVAGTYIVVLNSEKQAEHRCIVKIK
ncbi:MAG: alkaline phosphatase D family protein [Saprospiraceae bacterium]|nr:alkaline phosphatase D family protein [Saprospiraceae bacterium]